MSYRVETRSGVVLGESDGAAAVWRGVPYAAPPVGELRGRAPRPVTPWAGTRDATRFGPVAPQQDPCNVGGVPRSQPRSEDCLSLNIWSPGAPNAVGGRALHPVVVWIHGGAQTEGAGSLADYSGRALALRGDIVVITINYRLGILGQLDFSSFGRGRTSFDSNLGLRDQLAALEWVRDNISAFGGDPRRVTIMGESAGGTAVTTLMTVPAAAGLFRGAIAQSPAPTAVYSLERHAQRAAEALELLGIEPKNVKKLRDVPLDALVKAGSELAADIAVREPGTLAFGPVVDGRFLPEHPIDAFAAGRAHRVPLLIGTNRNEAALFTASNPPILPVRRQQAHDMLELFVPRQREALAAAYGGLTKGSERLRFASDWSFTIPTLRLADGHSSVSPTFAYRFDHATPAAQLARFGATHGTEIPFVFGTLDGPIGKLLLLLGGRRMARAQSSRMQEHWISFIRSGDAGWSRYDRDSRLTRLFRTKPADVEHPDSGTLVHWRDVPSHL